AEALRGSTGEDLAPEQIGGDAIGALEAVATRVPGEAVLQGSWVDGRIVVWAGGPGAAVVTGGALEGFLAAADASGIDWERHAGVPLPDGGVAEARSAPISQTLGWLVGIGSGQVSGAVAPSLRWLAELAIWGTELVAQGRMVPVLRGTSPGQGSKQASGGGSNKAAGSREKSSDTTPAASKGPSRHRVRWMPALVSRERFVQTVARMPGSVATLQVAPQPDGVCRSVLTAVVDAISRAGADRLVLPAATPRASTRPEISEAVLSGLDGRPFVADAEPAARLADDLKRWANPVLAPTRVVLIVRLDPPAADGGWQLSVEASGVDKSPMPIEHALVVASGSKAQQVEGQLRRLERLLPVLRRPTTRRGQVILDGDEAADLMFNSGPMIAAAGFEVYLPRISRRRPSPKLHLFAEGIGGKAQVGIQQLSNVRWSVFFDDLELDASAIARLVAEAKPLVQVKGRWVHIDRADLMDAAAALAERASITQLSGAALIRHAVGLEGGALGGPVEVGGQGWAVELLKGATTDPPAPLEAPPGFHGQLRHYQAEAAGWLGFLDRAGLGGCLAMDMGLGKTPTVLAHLLAHASEGPSLVVCPPAVLSNWATEAERFTPGLRVAVHHGPRRAQVEDIEHLVSGADVLLTTYTTGARDVDLLSRVDWQNLVIDEAQAIKNHQSDTARTLRQIPARSRLAMTGTPVENGLGDLWSILDFTNPGLVGSRASFIERLSRTGDKSGSTEEGALRALNGLLVFRRTKTEPEIAAELPDKVDKLDHCAMTGEQIGLYQAVIDRLIEGGLDRDANQRKGQVLAAITALKQICDHPAAYLGGDGDSALEGRSGKLTRLEEIVEDVFAAGERILIFTHFARWGERMAVYLSERTGRHVGCYHGGLGRSARDQLIHQFQNGKGAGALVLSIKAGGSGLNLTAASHVVLYDRWWNPAVEDQARDRAWRIGQTNTVMSHRLVCPGTVDERVEEIVAGKRQVAGLVLPARSSLGDLDASQLRVALGLKAEELIEEESSDDARLHSSPAGPDEEEAA
ncbi:MAG: DEAD/DEAH box helicase, partial [Acidimicrobiales bacterium]